MTFGETFCTTLEVCLRLTLSFIPDNHLVHPNTVFLVAYVFYKCHKYVTLLLIQEQGWVQALPTVLKALGLKMLKHPAKQF